MMKVRIKNLHKGKNAERHAHDEQFDDTKLKIWWLMMCSDQSCVEGGVLVCQNDTMAKSEHGLGEAPT